MSLRFKQIGAFIPLIFLCSNLLQSSFRPSSPGLLHSAHITESHRVLPAPRNGTAIICWLPFMSLVTLSLCPRQQIPSPGVCSKDGLPSHPRTHRECTGTPPSKQHSAGREFPAFCMEHSALPHGDNGTGWHVIIRSPPSFHHSCSLMLFCLMRLLRAVLGEPSVFIYHCF